MSIADLLRYFSLRLLTNSDCGIHSKYLIFYRINLNCVYHKSTIRGGPLGIWLTVEGMYNCLSTIFSCLKPSFSLFFSWKKNGKSHGTRLQEINRIKKTVFIRVFFFTRFRKHSNWIESKARFKQIENWGASAERNIRSSCFKHPGEHVERGRGNFETYQFTQGSQGRFNNEQRRYFMAQWTERASTSSNLQ